MTDEVKKYFMEQYEKSDIRVVPGHWPDFKSKEEVDKWLNLMESMAKKYFEEQQFRGESSLLFYTQER